MTKIVMRTVDFLMTYLIAFAMVITALITISFIFAPNVTATDRISGELTKSPNSANAIYSNDSSPEEKAYYNRLEDLLALSAEYIYPDYPRNQYGQTYGSTCDRPFTPNTPVVEPDLILACGEDRVTIGYVYKRDMDADMPNCPEEAEEYMKKIEEAKANGITGRMIALYDVDGRTVIGEFEIQYN